jgi:predicted secreted protein
VSAPPRPADPQGGLPAGVLFVAHCLLNQNAKVADAAHCPGAYAPVIEAARAAGWRIEQMPCPELAFAGVLRWWQSKEQYDTPAFRGHCARLAAGVADQVAWWQAQGVPVAYLGVDYSPTMGVTATSSDAARGGCPATPAALSDLVAGEGIFTREFRQVAAARGLPEIPAAAETRDLPDQAEAARRGVPDNDVAAERARLDALLHPTLR